MCTATTLQRALVSLAVLVLFTFAPLKADEQGVTSKGQVKVGVQKLKMDAGKLYQITVTGNGFQPVVNIRPGFFLHQSQRDRGDTFETFFVPQQTKDYRLFILPNLYDEDLGEGPFDYTLTLKNIPLAEKPVLKEETKLTDEDPTYKSKDPNFSFMKDCHFKGYTVKMKARQFYIIDMVKSSGQIDPYLYLEDKEGKIVAQDDDGGSFPNARIIYQPRREGEFRIIATTLRRATGSFTLTVQTQAQAKE